jgi:glycosyltransferase involved in cell wall biosynthesis
MSVSEADESGQTAELPLVSAIIPTVGRPSLVVAVESALAQSWKNIEVIVTVDGSLHLLDDLQLPDDPRVRVIASDVHIGAQLARGRGVAESRGAFVALLDDDDSWFPTKIENQFNIAARLFEAGSRHVLVACRFELVLPDGQVIGAAPRRVPDPQESIPEYLFVRRHIVPGEAVIASSMLFFDRELADIVPLDGQLPMHDDWDWLLTVQLCTGIRVEFSPDILSRYTQNPAGASVSSSGNWVSSSDWFLSRREDLSAREFSDGVLCICVPLAFQQGKWKEAGKLVRISFKQGSPGLPALTFAFLMGVRSMLRLRSGSRRRG